MHRTLLDRALVRPLRGSLPALAALVALALLATACLTENTPTMLRGEITRHGRAGEYSGVYYVVQECATGRRYELKLNAHAQVTLERNLQRVADEQTEAGPILAELGGKVLPATTTTKGDALFEVYSQYAVRPGACD